MRATRKILALACLTLLSLAGTASAHHGTSNATVYGAKLAGTAAAATTDPATAIGGLQPLPFHSGFGLRRRKHRHHGGYKRFDRESANQADSSDSGHDCDKG